MRAVTPVSILRTNGAIYLGHLPRLSFSWTWLDRGPVSTMALREATTETMTSFYGFPVGHWMHLRTMNVVESPFAVQLRTSTAKRFKMVEGAMTMT